MKMLIFSALICVVAACGNYKDPYENNKTDTQKIDVAPTDQSIVEGEQRPEVVVQNEPENPTVPDAENLDAPPQQNTEEQEWINLLADHRLQKFSRYNSGQGGEGLQSTTWIDLCAGGRFTYYSESSININGNTSTDREETKGNWTFVTLDGSIVLSIKPDESPEAGKVRISMQDGKFYMDTERWYRVPKGDDNGPTSCQ